MEHLPDFTAYMVALHRTFNASQYPWSLDLGQTLSQDAELK